MFDALLVDLFVGASVILVFAGFLVGSFVGFMFVLVELFCYCVCLLGCL